MGPFSRRIFTPTHLKTSRILKDGFCFLRIFLVPFSNVCIYIYILEMSCIASSKEIVNMGNSFTVCSFHTVARETFLEIPKE